MCLWLIGSHATPLRFTQAVLTYKNQILCIHSLRYSQFTCNTSVFLLIPLYDYILVYCPPLLFILFSFTLLCCRLPFCLLIKLWHFFLSGFNIFLYCFVVLWTAVLVHDGMEWLCIPLIKYFTWSNFVVSLWQIWLQVYLSLSLIKMVSICCFISVARLGNSEARNIVHV